jgi:hypothetical protein
MEPAHFGLTGSVVVTEGGTRYYCSRTLASAQSLCEKVAGTASEISPKKQKKDKEKEKRAKPKQRCRRIKADFLARAEVSRVFFQMGDR